MRRHYLILAMAMGWLGMPAAAWAILIDTGTGVPVGGYFHTFDGKTLVIRVVLPDGKDTFPKFDKAKVKILFELNKGHLEELDKDKPKAYLDYAEKLAGKELAADPEARYMARRLFLIAAYLDQRQFGPSALCKLASLAGTPPAEAQRCRAMAFVLDPQGDASVLKREALKPTQLPKDKESALQSLHKAMQCFRTGQIAKAKGIAKQKGMDKVFGMAPGMMMDQTDFLQWCDNAGTGDNPVFRDDVLRIVLRTELWVIDQLAGQDAGAKNEAGDGRWSTILQEQQASRVTPLSWDTIITGVDPRHCLYRKSSPFRNGVWEAP